MFQEHFSNPALTAANLTRWQKFVSNLTVHPFAHFYNYMNLFLSQCKMLILNFSLMFTVNESAGCAKHI